MTTTGPTLPTDARSREQLAALVAAGARPRYLLFWGHRPERDGRIGAGSLSQWWPGDITVDGETYRTAEHWMMAGKARLFGDEGVRAQVLASRTPGEAKKLGRLVRGFDEKRWAAERFELVVRGNVEKFGQDAALRSYLLGTGHRVLVEASPLDRVWGIGLAADSDDATRPQHWPGLNLLGFALMEARARLAG
ncbi:NADAR family protein [Kitasatospora sp. NBC_01539]|uniref:NADAR family protein n=1 Tax=Kitasatospora sp. NBC_01539 TaxID=2903577 RepID=UPI0038600D64